MGPTQENKQLNNHGGERSIYLIFDYALMHSFILIYEMLMTDHRCCGRGWETGKQEQQGTRWRVYYGSVHRILWGTTVGGFEKGVFYNNVKRSGLSQIKLFLSFSPLRESDFACSVSTFLLFFPLKKELPFSSSSWTLCNAEWEER